MVICRAEDADVFVQSTWGIEGLEAGGAHISLGGCFHRAWRRQRNDRDRTSRICDISGTRSI